MKNSNVEGAAKCYMELVAESEQADRFGGLPVFRGGGVTQDNTLGQDKALCQKVDQVRGLICQDKP